MKTHADMTKLLFSKEEIDVKVAEIAKRISDDYKDQDTPLMLCTLKGAVMFFADLVRAMDIDVDMDFKRISSYVGTESSGQCSSEEECQLFVKGRNVIIVEDIIDTGRTMSYFLDFLKILEPKSVKICSMLSKPSRRVIDVNIDYLGFEIPDEFVIGYGLDYDGKYRNIDCIGVIDPAKI